MRYEMTTPGGVVFYYHITNKGSNKKHIVTFSYGSVKDGKDVEMNSEHWYIEDFNQSKKEVAALETYCAERDFKKITKK